MQHPAHALLTAGVHDFSRQFGVRAGEVAFAFLVQDAGQTYHCIGSGDQARKGRRIVYVGADHVHRR